MFDSITKALLYIRDSASLLWNARTVLTQRLADIDRAMKQAQAANDQPSLGKLILAQSQTQALLREQAFLWDKIAPYREWFSRTPSLGILPLLPVWITAGGIGLATTLYLFVEKVRNEGKTLDLIKAGVLKPADVQAMMQGGSVLDSAGSLVKWAAIGYALFLAGPMLFSSTRR